MYCSAFLLRTVKPSVNGLLMITFTKRTPRLQEARVVTLLKYSLFVKGYCMNTY